MCIEKTVFLKNTWYLKYVSNIKIFIYVMDMWYLKIKLTIIECFESSKNLQLDSNAIGCWKYDKIAKTLKKILKHVSE